LIGKYSAAGQLYETIGLETARCKEVILQFVADEYLKEFWTVNDFATRSPNVGELPLPGSFPRKAILAASNHVDEILDAFSHRLFARIGKRTQFCIRRKEKGDAGRRTLIRP
jgi:hypothetical protein